MFKNYWTALLTVGEGCKSDVHHMRSHSKHRTVGRRGNNDILVGLKHKHRAQPAGGMGQGYDWCLLSIEYSTCMLIDKPQIIFIVRRREWFFWKENFEYVDSSALKNIYLNDAQ